jgi:hypothetical protein
MKLLWKVDGVVDRLSALLTGWIPERWRWLIADRLNDWLPRQCWADWVGWAMREPRRDPDWRSDVPYRPINASCYDDARTAGRCYCGTLGSDGTTLGRGETVCVTRMPGRETDRLCSRPNGHDGMHRCGGVEWGAA